MPATRPRCGAAAATVQLTYVLYPPMTQLRMVATAPIVNGRRPTHPEAVTMVALAVGVTVSSLLYLHLTRGSSFGPDEYWYFVANKGFDVRGLLSAHNGNLIAVIRLLYAIVFALAGPNYLVFRIIEVVCVSTAGILFFILARRRVGPVAALALTAPLLFLAASPDVTLLPLGITHVLAVVFGLAALLALEAHSRRGDALACVLLCLSLATFSVGFAFVAAGIVSTLIHHRRLQRSWIWITPLALYLLWRLAAPKYTGAGYLVTTPVHLANVRLIPWFALRSAAASAAAISGLYRPFGGSIGPLGTLDNYGVGFALLGLGAAGLAIRAARGELRRTMWPFVALAVTFWSSIVMVLAINRYPNSTRYLYDGGVALLLIAAEGLRGVRWRPPAAVALCACAAVSVGFNVAQLHADAAGLRFVGGAERGMEAGMELARGHVRVNTLPISLASLAGLVNIGGGVRPYLHAVERWGSPAFTLTQLRRSGAVDRALADTTETIVLGVALRPVAPDRRRCALGAGAAAAGTSLTVPPAGLVFTSERGGEVLIGRFADRPLVPVGAARPGRAYALQIPPDRADRRWRVKLPAGATAFCQGAPAA